MDPNLMHPDWALSFILEDEQKRARASNFLALQRVELRRNIRANYPSLASQYDLNSMGAPELQALLDQAVSYKNRADWGMF